MVVQDVPLTDSSSAEAPPRRAWGRSRRFWIVLAAVIVVLAGAGITAVAVSFRYLHAAPLSTDGGGWLPPDNGKNFRFVEAGPYTASIVRARPGHAQTFELDLNNLSPVSQTVLGLADARRLGNPRSTAEPVHLVISTTSVLPARGPVHYTSQPVTIPPNGEYRLRFTIDTGPDWGPCESEYWQSLDLRVRVGVFTRTETLDFDDLILELQSAGPGC